MIPKVWRTEVELGNSADDNSTIQRSSKQIGVQTLQTSDHQEEVRKNRDHHGKAHTSITMASEASTHHWQGDKRGTSQDTNELRSRDMATTESQPNRRESTTTITSLEYTMASEETLGENGTETQTLEIQTMNGYTGAAEKGKEKSWSRRLTLTEEETCPGLTIDQESETSTWEVQNTKMAGNAELKLELNSATWWKD